MAFAGVSLLLNSPLLALTLFLALRTRTGTLDSLRPVLNLLSALLDILLTGALTFGVIRSLSGQPARFGEMVGMGFSRIAIIFGVSFAVGLRILLGLVLLIIPGIVTCVQLWVAVPAALNEPHWRTSSLDRSRDLTKGYRLSIFLAMVVFFVSAVLLGMAADLITPMILGETLVGSLLLETLVGVIISSVSATAPAVAYHDLRLLKEGGTTEQIAAVFE